MNDRKFMDACLKMVQLVRDRAPKDTGNLAYNAVKYEFKRVDGVLECNIYVDEDVAPYMPFTNEEWISPRWNGKQNRNEDWWNRTGDAIAFEISKIFNGVLK